MRERGPRGGADELVGVASPGSVEVANIGGGRALLRPVGVDGGNPSLQWSKDGLWFVLSGRPTTSFERAVG